MTEPLRRDRSVPPAVRRLGRQGVRGWGMATASFRPLPDFMIIGAKRCGTTSLYRYLAGHPAILGLWPSSRWLPMREDQKGVHYFDTGFEHSARWYRSHFPSVLARRSGARKAGEEAIAGEASPYYLFHPVAPDRARRIVPDVKLIVLLRDPIQRAYSHYREQVRNSVETLTFEDAIKAEPDRLTGAEDRLVSDRAARSFAHEHQSYTGQSEYIHGIRRWLAAFPRERLLVVPSERFYAEPQSCYDEVLAFLDLSTRRLAAPRAWNAAPPGELSPHTWENLRDRFSPGVAALEAELGLHFPWMEGP